MRQFTVHRSLLTELFVINQLPDFPKILYPFFMTILSDPSGRLLNFTVYTLYTVRTCGGNLLQQTLYLNCVGLWMYVVDITLFHLVWSQEPDQHCTYSGSF
jgi:hypothetical protein